MSDTDSFEKAGGAAGLIGTGLGETPRQSTASSPISVVETRLEMYSKIIAGLGTALVLVVTVGMGMLIHGQRVLTVSVIAMNSELVEAVKTVGVHGESIRNLSNHVDGLNNRVSGVERDSRDQWVKILDYVAGKND